MSRPNCNRRAYRCSIAPEYSSAQLRIGRRNYDVNVLDTSRDAYTIRVSADVASRIEKNNTSLELLFRGERWKVKGEAQYRESEEVVHIGLVRICELTKVKIPTSHWSSLILPQISSARQDPAFLLYLMFAFLLACICLPGMGDSLGTAPKVRDAIHSVMDSLK